MARSEVIGSAHPPSFPVGKPGLRPAPRTPGKAANTSIVALSPVPSIPPSPPPSCTAAPPLLHHHHLPRLPPAPKPSVSLEHLCPPALVPRPRSLCCILSCCITQPSGDHTRTRSGHGRNSTDNVRRKFRHHGSSRSVSRQGTMTADDSRANGGVNERTPLVEREAVTLGNAGGLFKNSNGTPLYQDERAWVRWPMNFFHLTWETLRSNYVNVLLVFVPVGIVLGALGMNPTAVFVVNFLAIVPLAALLSFATEELSVKLGQTIGGLMNATFGNAVELIVSIVALQKGEIRIVQSSMLGSILSNILLVLGCCFIASGVRREQSTFNGTVASTMSSLMAVSATCLIIPATLYASLSKSAASAEGNVLILSRGTAVIMLVLYCLYLYFQLYSHAKLFDAEAQAEGGEGEGQSAEPKEPEVLGPVAASIALVLVTVLVAICAEYLVDSIDSIVQTSGISKTFIGLILLPIVGNAAEHVTACVVAYKDKMDLAIGVAIGSSLQIALFVTPALVILGWIMGQEMTLHFQGFETVVFFLSVLVVNYLIQDGKSNYLEGAMCIGTYIIIALAFVVYPDDAGDLGGALQHFFSSR
nr:vacuolar calcium ion transporter [Quercus suber]